MNNEFFKKYAAAIVAGIIIVAAIIVIAVVASRGKPASAPDRSDDVSAVNEKSPTSGKDDAPSGASNKKSSVVTTIAPQVSAVSAMAVATDADTPDGTKHGLFTIQFRVSAADKPLYISNVCGASDSTNGISFILTKDGGKTTDGYGADSCLITTTGGATQVASKRFLVPAYQSAGFQIALAVHPSAHGSYRLILNHVGFSSTDMNGSGFLRIDGSARAKLVTNAVSL